jgi:CubicO group peptidase (beta-lactamase class C family)
MRRRFWTRQACWLAVGVLLSAGCGRRGPEVFPGEEWSWKSPEAAGFSPSRLEAVARKVGGAGCIVHGGEMVFSWGDIRKPLDAGSSIKPIYGHLVYKAVETGRIPSLDARVVDWVPEIGELNAELGYKDREITFCHLLNHLSGYGLAEKPGEAFAYNDYAVGLLAWTLFNRMYDPPADEVLNGEWLGAAIGFEDRPTAEDPDSKDGRIRISARDMARFALLYLRGGRWGEKQVLRPDLVREAMGAAVPVGFPRTSGEEAEHWREIRSFGGGKNEKNHLGCHNGFWWFNRRTPDGGLFLPDVPEGAFMGSGWGGRAIMMAIPKHDLVVVWLYVRPLERQMWTPLSERGRFKVNGLLKYLLEARTGS